jgi:cell wall-associated NlpC family hydrolase
VADALVYDPTTAPKKAPLRAQEDLPIAAAGEGAPNVRNPLAGLMRSYTPEAYDAITTPAVAGAANTGVAASGTSGIVNEARKYVGVPYVWGGTTPKGFDCSGFTQYVFKAMGINLPRISYQQANAGSAVAPADVQPGDLVWWNNSSRNPGADHIGIALGNGMFIQAPKPGDRVKISKLYGNYGVTRIGGGR